MDQHLKEKGNEDRGWEHLQNCGIVQNLRVPDSMGVMLDLFSPYIPFLPPYAITNR